MLPEDRNDERSKNGSTVPNEFDGFEEVDDDDLVEIGRYYEGKRREEEEVQELRVLVVKPGNEQRLLTCDVRQDHDERDILKQVHKLFADRDYRYSLYAVYPQNLGFDYIVQYYDINSGNDGSITNDFLRENYPIAVRQDDYVMDDEIVEVIRKEANKRFDEEVIEEILTDDEVSIEKIIIKQNLVDESMEEVDGNLEVEGDSMEVECKIEDAAEKMEEDVLPIDNYATQIKREKGIEEIRRPIAKYTAESEEEQEIKEIRTPIYKCSVESEEETEIEEIRSPINKHLTESEEEEIEEVREPVKNSSITENEEETEIKEIRSPINKRITESEEEEIEEVREPVKNFSIEFEEVSDIEEIRAPIEKCIADLEEDETIEAVREPFKKSVNEFEQDSDIEEMLSPFGDKFGENVTQIDKDGEKIEGNVKSVEDFLVKLNECGSEKDWLNAMSEESEKDIGEENIGIRKNVRKIESDKESEESEKEMDEGSSKGTWETVCILDDTVDDDENGNTSQTSGGKTTLFSFPMSRGSITVTRDDYECLNEHQYLNDIIIDFYLSYLMQEVLSAEDRQRTYLFSSHFYTRLTKPVKDPDTDSLSPDERRYAGVHRWTKNVDIFEKDFIIIPINEHSHWFLAIICFPKLVDFVGLDSTDCEVQGTELQKPCILMFDSLGQGKKSQIAVALRGYLRHEYMSKKHEEKDFTYNKLRTEYPKIPHQQNATDCGLYLLQYVESFFKNPLKDFTTPLKDLSKWFSPTVIERKRERIAKLIAKLAVKYHKGKAVNLPMLKLPKPKLPSSEKKESSSPVFKKRETSSKIKSKFQSKKKSLSRRTDVSKRLKTICDSDSSSDSPTIPMKSTWVSKRAMKSTLDSKPLMKSTWDSKKLHISAHNPQPLRRSANPLRGRVPNYYPLDESDDSLLSSKSVTSIPASKFYSNESDAESKLSTSRTYSKSSKMWKDFSDFTETKEKTEKQDFSNAHESTKMVFKNNIGSTDKFYNLSLHALVNSPTLPTDISFSDFKIKKKNLNFDDI